MRFNEKIYYRDESEIESIINANLPLPDVLPKYSDNIAYYSTIELFNNKLIERIFAIKKDEIQEIMRKTVGNLYHGIRNYYYTGMCGYRVVWKKSKPSPYCFSLSDRNKWLLTWGYAAYPKYLFDINYLVKLCPQYKYCVWDEKQPLCEYLSVYEKYPELEILSKCGYAYLYNKANVLKALKNKSFKKFIVKNMNSNLNAETLLMAYRKKISIDGAVKLININHLKRYVKVSELTDDMNKDLIYEYLIDNNIEPNIYNDFLKAVKFFKLDLTKIKNICPKDFNYWHDYYCSKMSYSLNKEKNNKIKETVNKYLKCEGAYKGFNFILAKDTYDLIKEGESLHHCVGRMGYDQKIADGKSLIVFVRNNPSIPLYTMEYDLTSHSIKQCYGSHNSAPNDSILKIIKNYVRKYERIQHSEVYNG